MWRPRRLGRVIAERKLRLVRPRRPHGVVIVRFGQPVRTPSPRPGDPWWCPVEITGLGKRSLRPIAGEDSLQALVLAFEFVTNILPVEAERAYGRLDWLGERERLVFANAFGMRSPSWRLSAPMARCSPLARTPGSRCSSRPRQDVSKTPKGLSTLQCPRVSGGATSALPDRRCSSSGRKTTSWPGASNAISRRALCSTSRGSGALPPYGTTIVSIQPGAAARSRNDKRFSTPWGSPALSGT